MSAYDIVMERVGEGSLDSLPRKLERLLTHRRELSETEITDEIRRMTWFAHFWAGLLDDNLNYYKERDGDMDIGYLRFTVLVAVVRAIGRNENGCCWLAISQGDLLMATSNPDDHKIGLAMFLLAVDYMMQRDMKFAAEAILRAIKGYDTGEKPILPVLIARVIFPELPPAMGRGMPP
ncbi:MAG: hypothetical protein Q7S66_01905 [bacterium]|nr:hypothetical protein [bacterium]